MNHAKAYRFRAAIYDGTNDDELAALAMDIVYYDPAPLCEWSEFDPWVDGRYTPSEVYRAVDDKRVATEIAREFAFYMADEYRDHVIEQALLEGAVEVVE